MNFDIDFDIMREPGFFNRVLSERKSDWSEINKIGFKIITQCPICSTKSIENEIFYKTEFGNYLKCKTCSCLYLENVPMKPNTGQYSTQTIKTIDSVPEEKKREYRKERFGNERLELIEKFSSKPLSKLSLLDVGCNTGFFIEKAKESIGEVCGLEIEPVLAQYAGKKTGCKVYAGDISQLNRKFDVITLFDTVEHLDVPVSFLQRCSLHLNDNGLLVIFTPNYESFGFKVLGSYCNHITPGHLVLFCEETIAHLIMMKMVPVYLQTAGMDIFDIVSYERDILKQDISKSVLFRKANEIQNFLNEKGDANSLRLILKKGEL